jgi:YD repeat-containing protein
VTLISAFSNLIDEGLSHGFRSRLHASEKKTHDAEGRRLSRSVGGSTWTWTYPALGLVETATDANDNETRARI